MKYILQAVEASLTSWALKSAAFGLRDKGNHIITTKIEHHAILNTCAYLERMDSR